MDREYVGIIKDTLKKEEYTIKFSVSDSATKEEIEREAIRVAFKKTDCDCIELIGIKKEGECCNIATKDTGKETLNKTEVCARHFRRDQSVTEEDILHDEKLMEDTW